MKNIRVLAAASLMLAMFVPSVFGQSRPRRVFKPAPETQQPSGTRTESPANPSQPGGNPNDRVNQIGRPPAPPVLRGPTRDPNETTAPAATPAESGPEEYGEGDTIRVDTTLVSLPVSVMDRNGKFIPNLLKDDFHIWENGVEQQVAYFASTEKPFTVALVIDTSGSTKYVLTEIQDAAIAFVEQLRPDDQVMVFSFSDRIRNLTPNGATSDRFELRDAIRRANVGSGTKLYDAVDTIINQHFNHIPGRKAMVLFTDGVDTTSNRGTYETTVRDAEEVDALIYPVLWDTYDFINGGRWPGSGGGGNTAGNKAIDELFKVIFGGSINIGSGGGGGGGAAGTSKAEYELGSQYLHDLARVTGARLYQSENENFTVAFRSVAEELRRQYSLGYYPKNKPNAGERRSIRVRVDRAELVVRTRDSYIFQPRGNASAQPAPQPKPPVFRR